MEIPIQVAVRIFPCAAASAIAPIATEKEHVRDGTNSHNNNNKTNNATSPTPATLSDANGNATEPTAAPLNDDDDAASREIVADNRCCVQCLPMAAPNFMGGISGGTAIPPPGQMGNGIAAGIVQVGAHSFPVTHALPANCTQSQIYHQSVFPLISLFMEGFDASVVTYGQEGTGKSYTLFGPGFDCVYGEADQGVVQRCVREIFAHMATHAERTYAINIGWVEIFDESIRDLLGVGNVHCQSISDVFHWLQLGLAARAQFGAAATHSLFTITLEQQWISKAGLIQHRLSTASFSDLCGTSRICMLNALQQPTSIPKDVGLQSLEQVVSTLIDPALMYGGGHGNIPYHQTTLTTLLKDSFGGRAQTLLILCVSPLQRDINETICNLQFAFKVQCVRNYVIMNTFSDDNTPLSPDVAGVGGVGGGGVPASEHFGLQFAASQWFKLVANAEGLFAKLVSSNALNDLDKEQIEEWLFLKQECEECLSSSEAIRSQKQLGPIQEAEEPEETLSEPETSCPHVSDNDSDSESQRPDLAEKLEMLMEELRLKTDNLVLDKYKDFLEQQPKAVMQSQEQLEEKQEPQIQTQQALEKVDDRRASVGGRRRSIQPGASLSSAEIAMLNRVATNNAAVAAASANTNGNANELCDSAGELPHAAKLRAASQAPQEQLHKKLRKLDTDIEARQRQIKELEQTLQLKQNIIAELVKNSDTRSTAKQRFNKKKSKLEAEYEKTRKQLAKALVQGKDKAEIERLRAVAEHMTQRLQDLVSIKHIAGESGQKLKKLQQSLHDTRKMLDELQKKLRKEQKLKQQLENELQSLRDKENTKALMPRDHESGIKEMQARLTHLDHVLKEKSENLESEAAGAPREGLRHEIRNLRRTRDHLLEQRMQLDRKLKREKALSQREERKLLECDEAIEAIDAAIEFKNELICGHKSIDTSESLQREKGEQMLMARLNRLSPEEMRTLLYKYFTKVIDLRDSSRKLELQLLALERERDAWEWKERVLSNAVRQARLEGERNAMLLQRQHETKLTLMLRHLAEETSASSASYTEPRYALAPQAAYANNAHATATTTTTTTASPLYSDSDMELDYYKPAVGAGASAKMLKHKEMEICPLPDALTKYKPLDKLKEKERESKNKLFAKFQVLTRYGAQTMSMGGGGGDEVAKKKDKNSTAVIPQENLKRLLAEPPTTKVTRQKNKIIIQDASRKN